LNLNGLVTFTNNPVTFTGVTTLTNNAVLAAFAGVNLNGPIGESGGARSLTLVGSGSVTLNNSNSYSGGTNLASVGTLVLGSSNAGGTGPLTLVSGTLSTSTAVTLANPVVLSNGAVTINSTFAQGTNLTFTNTV